MVHYRYRYMSTPPIWFYLVKDLYGHTQLRGPVYREEVIRQILSGTITDDTQVRIGQEANWRPASSSEILKPYLDKQKIKVKHNKTHEKIKRNSAFILGFFMLLILTAISVSNRPYFRKFSLTTDSQKYETMTPKLKVSIKPYVATRGGIIKETNKIRQKNGLPPLVENQLLNQIANERLEDMFKYQYVAHVSPSGEKYSTIAQRIGYHYKKLAENIASIGDSATDAEFLSGWMQSPGHRSAILDNEVREIGVAVRNGHFKYGVSTIGVQIFGLESPEIDK